MPNKNFYRNVLDGKEEVEKVYESENILSFYMPDSEHKTHIVFLPKKNIMDFASIKESDASAIWEIVSVARYLCRAIDTKKEGANFYSNIGNHKSSTHLAFHLVAGKKI